MRFCIDAQSRLVMILLVLLNLPISALGNLGEWRSEIVDTSYIGAIDAYNRVVVDSLDGPSICYWHAADGQLYLAERSESQWNRQIIGPYGRGNFSYILDNVGNPTIAAGQLADGLFLISMESDLWDVEHVVANTDVRWPSLRFDTKGFPHIVYHDYSSDALMYMWETSHGWNSELITMHQDRPSYPSMDLDSFDDPHIAFRRDRMLAYATRKSQIWSFEIADSTSGKATSIQIDGSDTAHISYIRNRVGIKYAKKTTSAWMIEFIEQGSVGGWPGLVLDEFDTPRIGYRLSQDGLHYANRVAGIWQIATVAGTAETGVNNGLASLAIDSHGRPHVSYQTSSDGSLRYVSQRLSRVALRFTRSTPKPSTPPIVSVFPNPSKRGETKLLLSSVYRTAQVKVYDLAGRSIRSFSLSKGSRLTWDGRANTGLQVSSGTYFIRVTSGDITQTTKIRIIE